MIIRSASGDRDAVVVKGDGMTGSVGYGFKLIGDDITVADLTVGDVAYHPIQIHGEADADRILIHNVRLYDGDQQFIKGSYDKNGAPEKWSDEVVVEDSLFEYTAGHSRQRYTGGIDVHHGVNWRVRNCVFRNFRSLTGGPTQDHAVHFWTWSSNVVVEQNCFINCDRGIGLGESGTSGFSGGGVIRNNMIYNDGRGIYNDVGIVLGNASDAKVYNNTVYLDHDYPNAIEYRFTGTVADVRNNLVNRKIVSRNEGVAFVSNNLEAAQSVWFISVTNGDLHLKFDVASVIGQGDALGAVTNDYDGDERSDTPDIGADEKQHVDLRVISDVLLSVDKTNLVANGRDSAIFSVSVRYNDNVVEPFAADRFVCLDSEGDPVAMDENSFAAYETNAYQITAFVGSLSSAPITIQVCHEDLNDRVPQLQDVIHRDGQSFITFREVVDLIGEDVIPYKDFYAIKKSYTRDISYRVYRSSQVVTNITDAEMVGEIDSLSGWNQGYYGAYTYQKANTAIRYTTENLGSEVARDTGIFVHNADNTGTWYYAITTVVDDQEMDLLVPGTNTTLEPVMEMTGDGTPVLQRVSDDVMFAYIDHADVYEYVRWEHANEPSPNTNREGRPYDYLVAIPENLKNPAPLGIHFHCWGGNMFSGFGWWFDGKEGSIMMSSNQDPYDWWTGYHVKYGMNDAPKSQSDWERGTVRPYSSNRMKSFYEWVRDHERWAIDDARVFSGGQSMGGSGSIMFTIRCPEYAAWNVSWVGVHVPSMSPQFESSYRQVYGDQAYDVRFEDGTPIWDYYSDVWYLTNYPTQEVGFITFSNGKNDSAIGWEQAVRFYETLQETKRPHMFSWGQAGHGQRAATPNTTDNSVMPIDIQKAQSLPAFTHCQLDGNPGNGDPLDGDESGYVNRWLYWETSNVVDTATNWAMTVALMDSSPQAETRVDITPRNLQNFQVQPGFVIEWNNVDVSSDSVVESGEVIVDSLGLVTLEQVLVSTNQNRFALRVSQKPKAAFVTSPERGNAPLNVQFTDTSGGQVSSWEWDFDNDGEVDSTLQNPANTYGSAGLYSVKLTVAGAEGSSTLVKTNVIEVLPMGMPVAAFSMDITNGIRPLTVVFSDESSGSITNRLWSFGDGVSASSINPEHTYTTAGTYTITLNVTGEVGKDRVIRTNAVMVSPVPVLAAFSVSKRYSDITRVLRFSDESSGDGGQWSWSFGDGSSSTNQHPEHQYTSAGLYDVSLTVSGPGGISTENKTGYIQITDEPGVNYFVGTPTDDVDEDTQGGMCLTREYLNLCGWGVNSLVGLRFTNVAIPQNSLITRAYLELDPRDPNQKSDVSVNVFVENSDDAASFTTNRYDLSARPRTAANNWVPPDWGPSHEQGAAQRTPDLSAQLQQIVNRPGWSNGNAVAVLFIDCSEDNDSRFISAVEDGSPVQNRLHVEFIESPFGLDEFVFRPGEHIIGTTNAVAGYTYLLQCTSNLLQTDYQTLQTGLVEHAQPSQSIVFTNTIQRETPLLFYRIKRVR
ncbi:MAG: PKD domain-containing protein [Spartobacteria bacterium]|nr:PKD domain-containing protein [Spartobacteria bacterium]